jgi:tetratricopeptide (TPR) repeat protein
VKFKEKLQWKIFIEKIPFFVLSLFFGLIAFKASATNEPFADSFTTNTKTAIDTGYNLVEIIVLISQSLFMYISKLVIPFKQSAIHPYSFETGKLPIINYLYLVVLISYLFSIVLFWVKQKKEIVLGLLFFIFNIFIVLHIKNFLISEHYAYLPAIGISILLINIFLFLTKKFKSLNILILFIGITYILVLSFITVKRNEVFKNSDTFWTDVVTKYPKVFIGYYNRGNYFQEQGDLVKDDNSQATSFYLKAIDDYSQTIDIKNNEIGALSNRGITYAKVGKFKEAVDDFNKVVVIDSTFGNVYSNRGNAKALLGDYNGAISDYNKALLLNPNFVDAIYNRGIAFSSVGQNKKAINDFNKVLTYTPDRIDILSSRGLCYFYENNLDSALNDFNIYLNIYITSYNILYYRALTFEKKNQKELAQKDFETIRNNSPQLIDEIIKVATNIENRADYYNDLKMYNDALNMFKDILKINPNYSVAYSRIGVVYGKIGNFSLAFENLNKAISLDPKNAQAFADRGFAYMLTGNNTQALNDMNSAILLNTNDYITFYNRALLFFKLGKNQDAISDLDEVIKQKPDYSQSYILRGQAFVKLNKKNEACLDFQKALELGNKDAAFYLNQNCK